MKLIYKKCAIKILFNLVLLHVWIGIKISAVYFQCEKWLPVQFLNLNYDKFSYQF